MEKIFCQCANISEKRRIIVRVEVEFSPLLLPISMKFRPYRNSAVRLLACVCLAFSLFILPAFAQQSVVDSLEKELVAHPQPDTTRVNILNELAFNLLQRSPQRGFEMVQEARDLAEKLKFSVGIARSYSTIGNFKSQEGKTAEGLEWMRKSLAMAEKNNDKQGIGRASNNLALMHTRFNDYATALEYFFKAVKIGEELENKRLLSTSLGNIGQIYKDQRNFPQALEYLNRAIAISKEANNLNGIISGGLTIGDVRRAQGDLSAAQAEYSAAVELSRANNERGNLARGLNSLGLIYEAQRETAKALVIYTESRDMLEAMKARINLAESYNGIGRCQTVLKNYASASASLEKGLEIAWAIKNNKAVIDAYKSLSALREAEGNSTEALRLYRRAGEVQDSVFDTNAATQFSAAQSRIDADKREREELRAAEQQASFRRTLLWGGAAVLGIAGILVWFTAQSRRRSLQLSLQNAEMQAQQAQLAEQTAAIQAANAAAAERNAELDTLRQKSEESREYLAKSVETMLQAMERLSSGDLTLRLESGSTNDDVGRLRAGIGSTITTMRQIIGQLSHTTRSVTDAAREMNETAFALQEAAQHQAKQADNAVNVITDTSRLIETNAATVQTSSEAALRNQRIATESGETIQQTIAKMRRIADVISTSSEMTNKLAASSEHIVEFVEIIKEIADQTNLLALNASIEAARAGEQGRGFAVVADEVRKLAERSAQATKSIVGIVKEIMRDTSNVAAAMKTGTHEAEEGIALADKTVSVLQSIIQGAGANAKAMSAIALAGEEQMRKGTMAQSAVQEIVRTSEVSLGRIETLTNLAEQLAQETEELEQHLTRFRL